MVCAGVVVDGGLGEAGDELVCVTDALSWAERVATAVAVVFLHGEKVVVVGEFVLGEEGAEGGEFTGVGGARYCVKGADVHEVGDVAVGEGYVLQV